MLGHLVVGIPSVSVKITAPAMVRGHFFLLDSTPIVPGRLESVDNELVEEAGMRQGAANQKTAPREVEILREMEDALEDLDGKVFDAQLLREPGRLLSLGRTRELPGRGPFGLAALAFDPDWGGSHGCRVLVGGLR